MGLLERSNQRGYKNTLSIVKCFIDIILNTKEVVTVQWNEHQI